MAYSNKRKNNNGPRVDIGLSYDMVDLMIEYSLSDSPLVNLRSILNLKNLVDRINFADEVFENRLRFDILKTILKNQVDNHIFNYGLLKIECCKNFPGNEDYVETVFHAAVNNPVNENDIEYLNEYVEERLTYFYLYESRDRLKTALESLETDVSMEEINGNFETIISRLYKDIQNSKAVKKDSATDFCIGGAVGNFKDKNLASMTKKTIDDLRKPSNHIKCGVKAFNDILGGGLENGRSYLVYAPPKSWKSGLLMNMGIWACRYNEFIPKDPAKTPCVLYVTMENTSKETIKRLFTHVTGKDIKHFEYNEATQIINDYIVGDRNVSFEIKYRKNKSISTDDLDAMVDELALEGKEVVMIIQDYTKRIRSSTNNPDLRLELGDVVNDFCSIARSRDIPVVSAAQINRIGISKIEGAIAANKGNLAKLIDKSDAGESALPLENVDYALCITPEDDQATGDKYLGVKLWVTRVENPEVKFFLHKFQNGMRLEEDFYDEGSSSIESLNAPKKDFNPSQINREKWIGAGGKVRPKQEEIIEEEVF